MSLSRSCPGPATLLRCSRPAPCAQLSLPLNPRSRFALAAVCRLIFRRQAYVIGDNPLVGQLEYMPICHYVRRCQICAAPLQSHDQDKCFPVAYSWSLCANDGTHIGLARLHCPVIRHSYSQPADELFVGLFSSNVNTSLDSRTPDRIRGVVNLVVNGSGSTKLDDYRSHRRPLEAMQ